MKRYILPISAIALLSIAFFSCNRPKTIETSTYSVEEKYYLTKDTSNAVLDIVMQMELPERYKSKQVLTDVRNSIIANILGEEYVRYNNREVLPAYAADRNEEYRSENLPFVDEDNPDGVGFGFNNNYEYSGYSLLNDERTYSYGVDIYAYMGGAHGVYSQLFFNYDLRTGDLISQNDIFTADSEGLLIERIKQNIIKGNETLNSESDLEEFFWVENIIPNDNFYITEDGINYVYNPYEIAPYVWGIIEAFIPYKEIKSIIKKDSPVSYLVK